MGCTIFVKLWQFHPEDRTYVHANLNKLGAVPEQGREGVEVSPLYKDAYENVRIEQWQPNASVNLDTTGGGEIFVLEGSATQNQDTLRKHSWLRVPINTKINLVAGPDGAKVWIKTGHLLHLS